MSEVLRIDTVSEHDAFYHKENLHPLVSIMDFDGRKLGICAYCVTASNF